MDATPHSAAPQPKNNKKIWLFLWVALVFLCCCLAGGIAALYRLWPDISAALPESESLPVDPQTLMHQDESGLPQGGLADDQLRSDVWSYMYFAMGIQAQCSDLDAESTTITVLQEPESDGNWLEEWDVACLNGARAAFQVRFTPSPSGGTDFAILFQ